MAPGVGDDHNLVLPQVERGRQHQHIDEIAEYQNSQKPATANGETIDQQ
jgi:hypothetical protein